MRNYNEQNPLLMIPGPVEITEEVLNAMTQRSFSHTEPLLIKAYQESLQNMKSIFGVSENYSPVVISGSGTLAMEIAITNLIGSTDDRLLVCETGYFGGRTHEIAKAFGYTNSILSAEIGHKINSEQLARVLEKEKPKAAFIQHVDTSTGVANDIDVFGQLCNENDVISIVDGVCAVGGQRLYQEKWNIDIVLTGAQKAFAVPPGLAILMYSKKAREISEERSSKVPSYYTDLTRWWPILEAYQSGNVKYFSTPATNLIVGLHQSTKQIIEEGIENRFNRHETLSTYFRSELEDRGFGFVTADDSLATTLSTVKYKDPASGNAFRSKMKQNGVLVAGGLQQPIANSYFRVGHMGAITRDQIDFTLQAINKSI